MKKALLCLSLIVYSLSFTKAQIINTLAGKGISGILGDGGPATAAQLRDPNDVSFDPSGNMYFSDMGNSEIRVVNSSGIISRFAGNGSGGYAGDGGPATDAELGTPAGITFDFIGNLYICDENECRIRKVNTSGIISTFAGNGTAGFSGDGGQASAAEINHPDQIVMDKFSNFYFSDGFNNRIRKISAAGVISTIAGNGIAGYTGDGGPATAAEINAPIAVLVDNAWNVYFADAMANVVRKINSSGVITTFAGNGASNSSYGDGGPATAAAIDVPYGLAMDSKRNICISEYNGNMIRRVDSNGIISTLAGTGATGFGGDGGPATAAIFKSPQCMSFDTKGNLYVADEFNYRIREISGGILSVSEPDQETNVATIYPNPNNGQFTIEVNNEKGKGNSVVEVYNMLGKKVYSTTFSIQNSTFSIDLSSQPAGIYLLKLQSEDGSIITKKIEVAK